MFLGASSEMTCAGLIISLGLSLSACGGVASDVNAVDGGADGPGDAAAEGGAACPVGFFGAKLIQLEAPGGHRYCMDQREVTAGEYAAFVAAKNGDTSGQSSECTGNHWEPALSTPVDGGDFPSGCDPSGYDPSGHPDHAVACVDFCDAAGFCAWAGKRLCGPVGGGGATLSGIEDPARSEWANACTQGGTTKYPFGDVYTPGTCVDFTALQSYGEAAKDVTDLALGQCSGSTDGFSDVYDLVGSVSEWTAECEAMGGYFNCPTHGVASMDSPTSPPPSCQAGVWLFSETHHEVGFRCCADVER